MFDKTAVDEYRSTTAPNALRQRVMLSAEDKATRRPIRILPILGALAACLVLIFSVSLRDTHDDVMISSSRSLSSTASLALPAEASARIGATHYASFTIAARDELILETDDTFYVLTDDGELINTFPYYTSRAVSVYWYILSPQATLTVNGTSYTLIADEDNGTFQIVQD